MAKKNLVFYSCSGAANVGEIADRAARQMMKEGYGAMWCLAGLAAEVEKQLDVARGADLNVVLEGCDVDCAKRVFEKCGLKNYVQIRIADLGIEKAKGVPITDEQVAMVVAKTKEVLATAQA